GRRVGKQSDIQGQTDQKRFLWQGLRMLREESPEQSSLYLYEPGSYAPLARVDQKKGETENTIYYYHTDQIGTPLEMTDAEGHIVWQAKYAPWGLIKQLVVNKVEQNLRFQGQYFDVETGLHYNTFRYYDPEIGRFITQDPIGLSGGDNLYLYAPNPYGWVDPAGLSCDSLQKLESRGYTGITRNNAGGLDYAKSNALYSSPGRLKPDGTQASAIVKIKYTGDYQKDFLAANKAGFGQTSNPKLNGESYVWHHLDDYNPATGTGTMQLVKTSAHNGIPHAGGVSQYQAATGVKYIYNLW
ncbi:RHS repeat-associated core domain-containing protein, partial [Pseudomonas syringae group genomosp. 3]|uniref:RHS repeat-associated core domain-containing protein n=3 Tax=Pseudomonas syringae group genomosp. 3 TaxID=251701 RepID=UPI001B3C99E7